MALIASMGAASAASKSSRAPHTTAADVEALANLSTVVPAVGVIEITDSVACQPSTNKDVQFSTALAQVETDDLAAEAARARLVREHLRLVEGPTAMFDLDHAEQEFEADRAELRADQQELKHVEKRIDGPRCNSTQLGLAAADRTSNAFVDVRMELPEEYLPLLEQALHGDNNLVFVYGDYSLARDSPAITTGKLASVENLLRENESIVVVRARVTDPLHRLSTGDLVGVDVQLDQCTPQARELANLDGTQSC
jgi:hypothetical protein